MSFKDILAISGQSGLFRFVSRGRTGVIIESLTDGKKITVPASARMSSMEDISIYTLEEDFPLPALLRRIFEKENGGPAISHKSDNNALKKYFAGVMPEYDRDRVYVSDMKKIIQWYNLMQEKGIITLQEESEESTENNAQ
ncbi:MAG: DUF5606 domain-containing protein [Bacteroidales bacterium]